MNADIHGGSGELAPWLQERIPLGRGGLRDELVGTIAFLLGDAGGYITGQVLPLDGGLTTR
jgi:3-oxoacyl-[acyl-carrier protein] reductase